ncbi:MAG: beta strand repeat-containing protein, partial [Armatimonadota bacterium]
LFAPSASIEVGSLLASSLSISNQDFLAGRYLFSNPGSAGSVVNQGNIVTANGYTALVGPQVRNDGVIVARAGSVALAAADRVSLDMIGDGLISVSVEQAALNASVVNTGRIEADGGTVVLTARSANALLDSVINSSGVIRANSLVERNGEIVLDGGTAGVVSVSGTLQAAGVDAGITGGTVKVLGKYVGLFDNATINASGDAGGGTVLVGGNYQGSGPEKNASATFMGADTSIDASAVHSGNGGTAIVWADGSTRVHGRIAARGGANAGNGGLVETSGKQFLDTDGLRVDTTAPQGTRGNWLLDPFNVTIVNGLLGAPAGTNGAFDAGNPNTWVPTGASTVDDADIEVNLATTNVTISTAGAGGDVGDITVQSDVSITIPLLRTLRLDARRNIDIQGNADLDGALTSTLDLRIGQGGTGGTLFVSSSATLPNGLTTGVVNVTGAGGTDTVNVTRDVATMTLTDAALAVGTVYTLNLSSIEVANLTGGAGANSITANTFTGTVTVNATGGIDTLTGNGANTTFIGLNAASAWDTTGANDGTYTSGVNMTTLTDAGNWVGGSGADTFNLAHSVATVAGGAGNDIFNIDASITSSLSGGADNDNFIFDNTFTLTGSVDGGGGSDTLNLSAYTTNVAVTLTGIGTDGFNATTAGAPNPVSGTVSNINVLNAGSGTGDSLTGINAAATWTVSGADSYSSTNTLSFSGVETLTGGTNADTFNISGAQAHALNGGAGADSFVLLGGATLTGAIDGGADSDTLSGSTTYVVNILNGGTAAGISGGFTNVENLTGTAGADTFTLAGGTLGGAVDGLGGNDSLTAGNVANTWTITSVNAGTVTGVAGGWSNIENLVGGTGADSFTGAGGSVGGSISDGGGGATTLSGPITSGAGQNYTAAVTLGGATILASTGGGAINLASTVNGAQSLAVNTSGATTFGGSVGGITALSSLNTDAGGTTGINGATIRTTGSQSYGDAVTLGAATSLTATTSGSVSFAGTVDGPQALTVNAPASATFSANVGGATPLARLTVNAPNVTVGNAATNGAQQYNGNAVLRGTYVTNGGTFGITGTTILGSDTTINTSSGNVTFGSTIDGNFSLAVNDGGRNKFMGAIGSTTALANISTDSPGFSNVNGNVTVTGSINFLDVTTANGVTMRSTGGGSITVNNATATSPARVGTTGAVTLGGSAVGSAGTPLLFIVTPHSLTLTQQATAFFSGPAIPGSVVFPPGSSITYNSALIAASFLQQQAFNAASQASSSIAAVIVEEANKTFGTDSVAEDVEYGFAGEIGATPPMDHRIDESGISTPPCMIESREREPCK